MKGHVSGATPITVTRNEILYALNQAEKFWLAIVFVGEDDSVQAPIFVHRPFTKEIEWGVVSVDVQIKALVERGKQAAQ